jgi:DNA segregation ATPase FtsK/SpoIIIE, S-DNA-T family
MAKKKKKKDDEKKKFEYSNEVIGIILILASIIGIGAYGPAGNFIRAFAIFLVGNIYIFLLMSLLLLGGYLILKRKMPNFSSLRWIGFYIIVISFLVLLHVKYITLNSQEGVKIITDTFDNLLKAFDASSNKGLVDSFSYYISNSGGGMIGALFTYLFYSLFRDGTKIVVITLIVIGTILLFNTSIIDLIKKIKVPKIKHEKKEKEHSEEEDKRIILSSKDIDKVSDKEVVSDEKITVINKLPTKAGFNLFLPKPPINTLDKLAIILPIITRINYNISRYKSKCFIVIFIFYYCH